MLFMFLFRFFIMFDGEKPFSKSLYISNSSGTEPTPRWIINRLRLAVILTAFLNMFHDLDLPLLCMQA